MQYAVGLRVFLKDCSIKADPFYDFWVGHEEYGAGCDEGCGWQYEAACLGVTDGIFR